MNKKMLALYGLKWNPFAPDVPVEALHVTPRIASFCWRVQQLVGEGGFALVTGAPGAGKSVTLRVLAERLSEQRDVKVGVCSRPQANLADFYREMGDLFGVELRPHNRWAGAKVLRERWQTHIDAALARPVLVVDDFAGIAVAAEVEVGIAPGMELGGASQGLAGADVAGALLGVVDDDDGDGVAALQLAQIGEQRRHFAAGVLIDAMQAHEGIEHEQARAQIGDGRIEASAVGLKIEPHGGCGDDLDVEIGEAEAEAGGGADAVEPPAHDVERVLGGVKQNAPGAWHSEATQARNAGRDRDGEVEREEGFAALGLAADDPDRLLGPQPGDEPALFGGAIGEAPGGLDRQQAHRRRPVAVLVSAAGGEHVSRNSFSSICRASRSAAHASSSPAMFMRARRLPWA